MKNEQDREQLQRYFGQGNNSDPLKKQQSPQAQRGPLLRPDPVVCIGGRAG